MCLSSRRSSACHAHVRPNTFVGLWAKTLLRQPIAVPSSDGGLHAASAAASAVSRRLDRIASAHGAASRRLFGRKRSRNKGPAATGGAAFAALPTLSARLMKETRSVTLHDVDSSAALVIPPGTEMRL